MGLTIYYSGTFKPDASLTSMIDEAVGIAEANQWEYFVFETEFPTNPGPAPTNDDERFGVVITPPDCESIHLWFNRCRQLGYYSDLRTCRTESWVEDEDGNGKWVPEDLPHDYKPGWKAFTKTQFAGVETHIKVVNLLRYFSDKYFESFEAIDDGEYWETGDEKNLRDIFSEFESAIASFKELISNDTSQPGENTEDFIMRKLRQGKSN